MPLTARLEDGALLDASTDDARWSTVHRNREARLSCPACSGRVVAKQMHRSGVRFFAHHRVDPSCQLSRETVAHRLLKLELAAACRAAGWQADLEVSAPVTVAPSADSRDDAERSRRWRADVLATSADGQRQAFEAQLATTPASEIVARHEAMTDDGVPAVWVTQTSRAWFGVVPSLRVELLTAGERWPDARRGDDGWVALRVTEGIATFQRGRWMRYPSAEPLASVVAKLLDGRLIWHQPLSEAEGGETTDPRTAGRGFFTTPAARVLETGHAASEPSGPAPVPVPRQDPSAAGAWAPSTSLAAHYPCLPLPDIVYPPVAEPRRKEDAESTRRTRTEEQTELLDRASDYVRKHLGVEPAHTEPHADEGYGKALVVRGQVVAILCPDPAALPAGLYSWVRLLVGDATAAAELRAAAPRHTIVVLPSDSAIASD